MRVSRDEAREIAIYALLITAGLRALSGVVQLIEELDRAWTYSSALGRLLAPVGTTIGLLVFGATLVGVLSPSGSVDGRLVRLAGAAAGIVALLGVVAVINNFSSGFNAVLSRVWFAMIEPMAATLLGATGWWLVRNLDSER